MTSDETIQDAIVVLRDIEPQTFFVSFILNSISVFINIFHLIILTRKSMRTSSINVLMIGIAACDLCTMSTLIYKYFFLVDRENPECTTSDSLIKVYLDVSSWSLQYHFRRCSCWLGIMIASVRYVIMKKMYDVKTSKLANPKSGFIIIAIIFTISGIVTILWQYECEVIENRAEPLAANCAQHQYITKSLKYSLVVRPISGYNSAQIVQAYFILDAFISNFIPCLAFPTLTIFLLREIRRVNRVMASLRTENPNRPVENQENNALTTKLILFLTFTFFLSEAPLGMIATRKTFLPRTDMLFLLSTDLTIYFTMLVTVNTILHPIFCIIMSTQYRETISSLVKIKRRVSVVVLEHHLSAISTIPIQMN